MTYRFYDKHGEEIKAGMTIRHDSGKMEKVYATTDHYGAHSLGIMATNPEYLKRHPDAELEYYDLSNFIPMSEWEIVKE